MTDNPTNTSAIKKVPITLMQDLIYALSVAGSATLDNEGWTKEVVGNNLLELLCNLMERHPEPLVKNWVLNELRNLDKGV
jgi:hypothetical protein